MTVSASNTRSTAVSLWPMAHVKMMLHAVRHSRSVIHGILLGKFTPDGLLLTVIDALPVCHAAPTKPLLDMALRLADSYCESVDDNIGIVGWYTANEISGDDIPKQAALKIISSIGENLSSGSSIPANAEPILTVITSSGLKSLITPNRQENNDNETNGGLQVYGSDGRKHWLNQYPMDSVVLNSPDIVAKACHSDCEALPFFDFEDHLEGGIKAIQSRDWIRNIDVANFVQQSII